MDKKDKDDFRELCNLATLKVNKLDTPIGKSDSFRKMCRFIMDYPNSILTFRKGGTYNSDFVIAVVLDFLYKLDKRYYNIAKEIILSDKIKIYNLDIIDLSLKNAEGLKVFEKGPVFILDEGMISKDFPAQIKPYMLHCPLDGDINDFYSLAHELIHAIDYEFNDYEYNYSHVPITEVPSYLIEVLLSEYLANNINIEEIRNKEIMDISNLKLEAFNLYVINIFLEIVEKEERITASNLKRYFKDNGLSFSNKYLYETLYYFSSYNIYSFNELSKYIIAYYIKEQYRINNKDSKVNKLEQFKTFLEFYQYYDIDESIKLLGINTQLESKKTKKLRKTYEK